jgi:hypothetical protein
MGRRKDAYDGRIRKNGRLRRVEVISGGEKKSARGSVSEGVYDVRTAQCGEKRKSGE